MFPQPQQWVFANSLSSSNGKFRQRFKIRKHLIWRSGLIIERGNAGIYVVPKYQLIGERFSCSINRFFNAGFAIGKAVGFGGGEARVKIAVARVPLS